MAIIKRPIITEKYTKMNEEGIYAFEVEDGANKVDIRLAIESKYGVNVNEVRTMRVSGKRKTRYGKSAIIKGYTNSSKKAIVALEEGEFIDFYEGM